MLDKTQIIVLILLLGVGAIFSLPFALGGVCAIAVAWFLEP
jgi:hypothetical protein